MKLPNFIRTNVPLAPYSTLGVGGPANYFAQIVSDPRAPCGVFNADSQLLQACGFARDNGLEIFTLGQGSNVLFADVGFRGLVICMKADRIHWEGNQLWVDAGVFISTLVNLGASSGLAGFECFAGLPGTVGGAIYGNAGCYGGQFWDVIEEVVFFDGEYVQTKKRDASMFGYRWSVFKENLNWIILAARLTVKLKDKKSVASETKRVRAKRSASQPGAKSIGCIFKNPTLVSKRMVPAGRLIDEEGSLKGLRIGGAMISNEHGNVFINLVRGTKARDFIRLSAIAKSRVSKKFGITLEEEIIRVGEF